MAYVTLTLSMRAKELVSVFFLSYKLYALDSLSFRDQSPLGYPGCYVWCLILSLELLE